ncbi:hypothetical protein KKF81_00555 [Candidatus Micrarchaeota archaeon]|nr:hypothetical protein [Candidatus Micrarchaeota archaeon]MBU1165409.1 hypothetical protein [Candidatus Micrarchaeota archaeon]MBU1886273.1 hypothetical protein [Candidatus Micrarchaeota archaeon]
MANNSEIKNPSKYEKPINGKKNQTNGRVMVFAIIELNTILIFGYVSLRIIMAREVSNINVNTYANRNSMSVPHKQRETN